MSASYKHICGARRGNERKIGRRPSASHGRLLQTPLRGRGAERTQDRPSDPRQAMAATTNTVAGARRVDECKIGRRTLGEPWPPTTSTSARAQRRHERKIGRGTLGKPWPPTANRVAGARRGDECKIGRMTLAKTWSPNAPPSLGRGAEANAARSVKDPCRALAAACKGYHGRWCKNEHKVGLRRQQQFGEDAAPHPAIPFK